MGNEYGVSTWQILQALGPIMFIGPAVIWFLVTGPFVIYPLARWRAHRDNVRDPQLGIKVALQYFALIAFQVVLFATAYIIYAVLSKSDGKGSMYRTGFGFVIPAGLVLLAHFALLRRTNQAAFPTVRRLFLGYNLLLTGLLGFITLLFAFQIFMARGSAGDAGRMAIAFALVYVGAWAACGIQFGRLVLGGDDHPHMPLHNAVPPSAPSPVPPSGPTLPSLSAGSFPPLDNK